MYVPRSNDLVGKVSYIKLQVPELHDCSMAMELL